MMAWQEGGGVMACGRIAEVVLLIYDFSTFSNHVDCRGYAQRGRWKRGRGETWKVRGIEVEGWSCSFDL